MKKKDVKINMIVVWLDPERLTSSIFKVVEKKSDIVVLKNKYSECEALYKELMSPDDTYICPQCGNLHMEETIHVDINTSKLVESADEYFCTECDETLTPDKVSEHLKENLKFYFDEEVNLN